MKNRGKMQMKGPEIEQKGTFANWSSVLLVEMKRNENNVYIFGDRNHRM